MSFGRVNMSEAIKAIKAHDSDAYDIVHTGGNYYSARIRGMIAYYEIIDGKIVGGVWYE
jgi:hypothetical protein